MPLPPRPPPRSTGTARRSGPGSRCARVRRGSARTADGRARRPPRRPYREGRDRGWSLYVGAGGFGIDGRDHIEDAALLERLDRSAASEERVRRSEPDLRDLWHPDLVEARYHVVEVDERALVLRCKAFLAAPPARRLRAVHAEQLGHLVVAERGHEPIQALAHVGRDPCLSRSVARLRSADRRDGRSHGHPTILVG